MIHFRNFNFIVKYMVKADLLDMAKTDLALPYLTLAGEMLYSLNLAELWPILRPLKRDFKFASMFSGVSKGNIGKKELMLLMFLSFYRFITIMVYLKEPEEGGETAFPAADNITYSESVSIFSYNRKAHSESY